MSSSSVNQSLHLLGSSHHVADLGVREKISLPQENIRRSINLYCSLIKETINSSDSQIDFTEDKSKISPQTGLDEKVDDKSSDNSVK